MTWLSSSDDVGVTGYRVRRDGAVVGTAAAAAFVDQGLSPNTVLCYTVSAYDAAGNESTPSAPSCATTLADTTAPGTPEGVLAQAVSATRIDVTWLASSDDVGVTGFRVRRDGGVVGTAAAPAFAAQGLSPDTVYCFTVSAYDAASNESTPSAPACATTLADTTPPGTPEGVLAQAVSPARIALAWNPASDDVGVTGYRIRRGGVPVATAGSSPWEDATRQPQTAYCYTASALDAAGNESAPSGPACATTPRRPIPATGHVEMALTDVGDGTVADAVTGLVWQQASPGPYNWYEATGTQDAVLNPSGLYPCGALVLGGHAGWRLPTDAELLDIAAYDLFPAIDTTLFPAPEDFYWASTPLDPETARIWFSGLGWLGVGASEHRLRGAVRAGRPRAGPVADRPGRRHSRGREHGAHLAAGRRRGAPARRAGRRDRVLRRARARRQHLLAAPDDQGGEVARAHRSRGVPRDGRRAVLVLDVRNRRVLVGEPGGRPGERRPVGLPALDAVRPRVVCAGWHHHGVRDPDGGRPAIWFSVGALRDSIVAGPDGNLWFSETCGIGRITPGGAITEFPLASCTWPLGITVGPDGNVWVRRGARGHRPNRPLTLTTSVEARATAAPPTQCLGPPRGKRRRSTRPGACTRRRRFLFGERGPCASPDLHAPARLRRKTWLARSPATDLNPS